MIRLITKYKVIVILTKNSNKIINLVNKNYSIINNNLKKISLT